MQLGKTPNAAMIDCPVVIVGAGPVGLALAAELGWRGVECLVIERRAGTVTHPKTNTLSTRTMEFCRRWGIANEIRAAGWPREAPLNVVYVTSLSGGHRIGGLNFPPYGERTPMLHTPEGSQRCSQLVVDPILQRHAMSLPTVTARFETEFEHFREIPDGIAATVRDRRSGERTTVRSQYIIGCDGAESAVRNALGIPLEGPSALGHEMNILFESQDLLKYHSAFQACMYWLYGSDGLWGQLVAVDGRGLWRLTLKLPRPAEDVGSFDALAAIRRAVGADINCNIRSLLPWNRRRVVARTYGSGRVFLAGDAVHQFSPTGALGMNTGLQEAVDLGWKLAGTLQGWGGSSLLASYEAERRPIALVNNASSANMYLMLAGLPFGPEINEDTERGREIRERARAIIEAKTHRDSYENEGVTVGYRYDASPICVDDGSPAPPLGSLRYTPTARPGARAPHAWLRDGRSTLDLFGNGFTLLRLGYEAPSPESIMRAADDAGLPLSAVAIEEPHVLELYERRLVLVRPDGHVAWRADTAPDNPRMLVDRVRGANG